MPSWCAARRMPWCAPTASTTAAMAWRSCSAIRAGRAARSETPSSSRSSTASTCSAIRRSSGTTRCCGRTRSRCTCWTTSSPAVRRSRRGRFSKATTSAPMRCRRPRICRCRIVRCAQRRDGNERARLDTTPSGAGVARSARPPAGRHLAADDIRDSARYRAAVVRQRAAHRLRGHHAGGLQNPLFLAVFALPVIGSIFLSRWQPYLMATLASLLVLLAASSEAPELRWYAPWLGTAGDWLETLLGSARAGASLPFAAFYAPSQYFVVLLEVFVVVMFACAVAAEYLANVFDRLAAQMWTARAEAARSQELWATLVEQLPVAAVLLDAGTHEVVGASGIALKNFLSGAEPVVGRDFFEAIQLSYPEPIERLVDGADGVEPLSMVRFGGRLLATEIRVQHLAQHGRRFAPVVINDTTEDFCVKAALDVAEYATLVADAQGRVVALNKPARALFGGASPGAEVSSLVQQGNPATRWWDPGLSGRHKMHVTVMRRMYQVTTTAVAMPGEDARLYVIAFLPMARVAAEDQSATTGSNTVVQWP